MADSDRQRLIKILNIILVVVAIFSLGLIFM